MDACFSDMSVCQITSIIRVQTTDTLTCYFACSSMIRCMICNQSRCGQHLKRNVAIRLEISICIRSILIRKCDANSQKNPGYTSTSVSNACLQLVGLVSLVNWTVDAFHERSIRKYTVHVVVQRSYHKHPGKKLSLLWL